MFSADESISIETPESITLQTELAGFGSRVMAAVIDYLILIVVMLLLSRLTSISYEGSDDFSRTGPVIYLILFAIFMFYHLVFEFMLNGQTPGKILFKIRVVQANGMPVTVNGVLIRNLVRVFDMFPAVYAVGLVTMFITRHTQRLGDLAARTIVIHERAQVGLATVRANYNVHYTYIQRTQPIPDYINIELLTEQDRHTVVNYLQRRSEMQGREPVAIMLAQRMGQAMAVNESLLRHFMAFRPAEEFLEYIARAFELAEYNPY